MPEEYDKYLTLAIQGCKVRKAKNLDWSDKEPASTGNGATCAGKHKRRRQRNARTRRASGRSRRDWLIEQGGVPSERIFVLEPKVEPEPDGQKSGSRAEFSLRSNRCPNHGREDFENYRKSSRTVSHQPYLRCFKNRPEPESGKNSSRPY